MLTSQYLNFSSPRLTTCLLTMDKLINTTSKHNNNECKKLLITKISMGDTKIMSKTNAIGIYTAGNYSHIGLVCYNY